MGGKKKKKKGNKTKKAVVVESKVETAAETVQTSEAAETVHTHKAAEATKSLATTHHKTKTGIIFTGQEFERAWNVYGTALGRWAESMAHLQKTGTEMMLSWFDVWQKTTELDAGLLRRAKIRWREVARGDISDEDVKHNETTTRTTISASEVAAPTSTAATAYAEALIKAQSESIKEFNRQWERFWQARP